MEFVDINRLTVAGGVGNLVYDYWMTIFYKNKSYFILRTMDVMRDVFPGNLAAG